MKKKAVSLETFVFLFVFILGFSYFSSIMGFSNFLSTVMYTAYDLLINVVFFIMAIAVIAGAFGAVLSEFGVVALINWLLSPFTQWYYKLPGVSTLGAVSTYLSDNPAIISLAKDKEFKKYFKEYQLPALCNLGTAFGMGLILTTFVIGKYPQFVTAAIIGNIGALLGSWFSVRLMLHQLRKHYGVDKEKVEKQKYVVERDVREGTPFLRLFDSLLDGGKTGVQVGLDIIPGVLVICTFIMLLTFGAGPDGVYTGGAKEGVALFTQIGAYISPVFEFLFGFSSPEAIAFPLTSLGSTGAAMGLIPDFVTRGIVDAKDIAVFVAIGMTWSGYLSTHVGMMDALGVRKLAPKAILSHTVGGIMAGILTNYLFIFVQFIQKTI